MAETPTPGTAPNETDTIHPFNPDPSPAPEWFRDALAVPADTHTLTVEGATITYRTWGRPVRLTRFDGRVG